NEILFVAGRQDGNHAVTRHDGNRVADHRPIAGGETDVRQQRADERVEWVRVQGPLDASYAFRVAIHMPAIAAMPATTTDAGSGGVRSTTAYRASGSPSRAPAGPSRRAI